MKRLFTIYLLLFHFISYGQKIDQEPFLEPIPGWVKSYPKPELKHEYDLGLIRVH